jgi:DNA-directed RNA polymerase specialized sigma subunit
MSIAKMQHEMPQAVTAAIDGLTRRQRAVFDLYFAGNRLMRQVGAEIGVGEAAISRILDRIRGRFKMAGLPVPGQAKPAKM